MTLSQILSWQDRAYLALALDFEVGTRQCTTVRVIVPLTAIRPCDSRL